MAQMVKNPPAIQETWVQYLGWEDPLEEVMTTHSSILAWSIPWTKEVAGHGSPSPVTKLVERLSLRHSLGDARRLLLFMVEKIFLILQYSGVS